MFSRVRAMRSSMLLWEGTYSRGIGTAGCGLYISGKGKLDLQVGSSIVRLERGNFAFINSNVLHAAKGAPKCTLQSFVFSLLLVTCTPSSSIAVKYITLLKKCTALTYVVIIISLRGSGLPLGLSKMMFRALNYV